VSTARPRCWPTWPRLDALLGRGLRARTTQVFQTWREAYRGALTRAQQRQIVLATVDPSDVAHLLVAQIEGTLSLARNTQDPQTLTTGARALRSYLSLHSALRAQ
jgi:Tetracyclin repressor-like, C-terminal domain